MPADERDGHRTILQALIDKSVAIFVLAMVLYFGYSYHTKRMEEMVIIVKTQNEYLRQHIDEKLDRILKELQQQQRHFQRGIF